jgi:hypothetical protein
MQARRIVVAAIATTFAIGVGATTASESLSGTELSATACMTTPAGAFMPEADLRAIVERLGYQVTRISTDSACYEVLATDRNGRAFEIRFKGADLRMISRYETRGERQSVAHQ